MSPVTTTRFEPSAIPSTCWLARNNVAVSAHYIDMLTVRPLRDPTTLGNVVIAGQTGLIYMRGGALYFTQDEDFLCLLWDEQLIAISDHHILRHTWPSLHDTIHIDDQSTDRLY